MFENFVSPDAPFVKILGMEHLIYLFFCITVVILFAKNYKWVRKNEQVLRKVFLSVLVFQQVFFLYGWYAVFTPNFWSEGLPLQMCRIASLLTIVFLINKNKIALDVLCYFSIFALISLFYPLAVYNFTHISGLSYMINHLITVLIPAFAAITCGFEPTRKTCFHAVIGFLIYFPIAIIANYLTGGNYFYQTNRPFLHSLSEVQFGALTIIVTVGGFIILTELYIFIKSKVVAYINKRQQAVKQ